MIIDLLPLLARWRVILASASPRRLEMLRQIGLHPEVVVSGFAEDLDKSLFTPAEYVVENARRKGDAVFAQLAEGSADDASPLVILATDSVVVAGGTILEKPAHAAEAYAMMQLLSGGQHSVVSGVSMVFTPPPSSAPGTSASVAAALSAATHAPLLPPGLRVEVLPATVGSMPAVALSWFVETEVTFAPLPATCIEAYVATRDPYDKAGGYGIQSVAAQFITGLRGCYYNVVGMPLYTVATVLRVLATTWGRDAAADASSSTHATPPPPPPHA